MKRPGRQLWLYPRARGDEASRATRETLVPSEPGSVAASPERDAADANRQSERNREKRGPRKLMTATEHAVNRTNEDYCRTPDDKRYELLNGELMMVPALSMKYQEIVVRLSRELSRCTEQHELGKVYVAPADVVLSDADVVQPDVLFISRRRERRITEENVRGAPNVVIEILSPSTADLDLGYKHELYGSHGVLECWIVDPVAETVGVHRPRDGRLEPAGTLGRGESLATAVLEELALKVDHIFAAVGTRRRVGRRPGGRRANGVRISRSCCPCASSGGRPRARATIDFPIR